MVGGNERESLVQIISRGEIGAKDSQKPGDMEAKVRVSLRISASSPAPYDVNHIRYSSLYPFYPLLFEQRIHAKKRTYRSRRSQTLPLVGGAWHGETAGSGNVNVRFKPIAKREANGAEENKGEIPLFHVHWQKNVLRARKPRFARSAEIRRAPVLGPSEIRPVTGQEL